MQEVKNKKNCNTKKVGEAITKTENLPEIPTKIYFTIGEVCRLCELKSHVLRYWEVVFPVLNPSKRRGRRYYKRDDIILVRQIRELLYEKGYTIDGASARLEKVLKQEEGHEEQFNDTLSHQLRATVHELEAVIEVLE